MNKFNKYAIAIAIAIANKAIAVVDLIKRGALRIFPKPAIAIAIAIVLIGCSTQRHAVTQLIEHTSVDTIYLSNMQYDSIYIYKDRVTDRSKDTVYLRDVSIEYRYKLLRDTIRVVARDSIPYEVTITETKEIQRPPTFYDHLTRTVFWLAIGALLSFIAFKLKSVFKR